jgi:SAM-dependent methyltransferase
MMAGDGAAEKGIALNLGCGSMRIKGAFGVDRVNVGATDVRADLGAPRLPFKSGSVSALYIYHVLEHVDFVRLMDEFHRVLGEGGIMHIRVPHASSFSFWDDPTHIRPFTSRTFDYWDPGTEHKYGFKSAFRVVSRRLYFLGNPDVNKFNTLPWLTNSICALINYAANLHIRFCERLWARYVGGFGEVYFVIKKL